MNSSVLHDLLIQFSYLLDNLAWYHYLIFFFVMILIFGKSKEWEFEVKLFDKDRTEIKGEIEIGKYKKKTPTLELKIDNFQDFYDKEVEIYLDKDLISKFKVSSDGFYYNIIYPSTKNTKKNKRRNKYEVRFNVIKLDINKNLKPKNNQKAIVKINGEDILSGILLLD